MVRPMIEQDLSKAMKGYAKVLEVAVGPAYVEQLARLSQEQIDQIQLMRRMWMPYVLKGGDRIDFEEKFIAPCVAAADAMLVKPEATTNEAVTTRKRTGIMAPEKRTGIILDGAGLSSRRGKEKDRHHPENGEGRAEKRTGIILDGGTCGGEGRKRTGIILKTEKRTGIILDEQ